MMDDVEIGCPYCGPGNCNKQHKICGRCYDDVDELFAAKCSERPEEHNGAIGMYHCPNCGAMLIAGLEHPKLCRLCVSGSHPGFDCLHPETDK